MNTDVINPDKTIHTIPVENIYGMLELINFAKAAAETDILDVNPALWAAYKAIPQEMVK